VGRILRESAAPAKPYATLVYLRWGAAPAKPKKPGSRFWFCEVPQESQSWFTRAATVTKRNKHKVVSLASGYCGFGEPRKTQNTRKGTPRAVRGERFPGGRGWDGEPAAGWEFRGGFSLIVQRYVYVGFGRE